MTDAMRAALMEVALQEIAGAHLGDCPAALSPLNHARVHISELRRIAYRALQTTRSP